MSRKTTDKQKRVNKVRSDRFTELINESEKELTECLYELSALYEIRLETLNRLLDESMDIVRSAVMKKIADYFSKGGRSINWRWLNGENEPKYLQEQNPFIPVPTSLTARNTEVIKNLLKIPMGKRNNVFMTITELHYLYEKFGAEKTVIALDLKSECLDNGTDPTSEWPSDYYAVYQMLKKEQDRMKKINKRKGTK